MEKFFEVLPKVIEVCFAVIGFVIRLAAISGYLGAKIGFRLLLGK